MTNSFAIGLGVLLIGAALTDVALTDGATLTALGRSFLEVIDTLRFWS